MCISNRSWAPADAARESAAKRMPRDSPHRSCGPSSTGSRNTGRSSSIPSWSERCEDPEPSGDGTSSPPSSLAGRDRRSRHRSSTRAGSRASQSGAPHPQTHRVFLGGDWQVRSSVMIDVGAGFDLTSRGPGLVLKTRFEWHSGRGDRANPSVRPGSEWVPPALVEPLHPRPRLSRGVGLCRRTVRPGGRPTCRWSPPRS
jgi:hypothetical protein